MERKRRRKYGIPLEIAQRNLETWVEAELALTTAQSYTLGSQVLTRADLSDIGERIAYWEEKVAELETAKACGKRNRVYRLLPRDG